MIFLGLGSNIGDRIDNLKKSIVEMERKGIRLIRCSSFYQTPAWGITDQEDFINAVCEVAYDGTAQSLLSRLLEIEQNMGRIRQYKWGPRLVDLDILEFHRQEINQPHLRIPHPYYPQRAFVLLPFKELEADWIPTAGRESISQLVNTLDHATISLVHPPFMIETDV